MPHNHLLITASSSTSLNTLGLSFPGCGAGVMLPISTKPNPAFNIPSTASPCLSKPAAKPTGLRNWRPNTLVCWIRHFKIRWSNTMKKILFLGSEKREQQSGIATDDTECHWQSKAIPSGVLEKHADSSKPKTCPKKTSLFRQWAHCNKCSLRREGGS